MYTKEDWKNELGEQIEIGDWVDEGKYANRNVVVKFQDKFYEVCESRSGSYYSDYYYNEPEIYEVIPVEEIIKITKWIMVKE